MLTSPITVTIDGVAHELSRINQDNYSSVYLKKWAKNELRLQVRHAYEGKVGPGQMERHNVDLVHTVFADDGTSTVYQSYTVIRSPRNGLSKTSSDLTLGLNAFVSAQIAAIVAWES